MIERYSLPQMRAIWSEENKFNTYLEVELLSAEAWCELDVILRKDVETLRKNARFSIPRIHELEEQTRHDIVAFTRAVSESLGEERKWVHYGLTSTDVVDTANGYIIKQANKILRADIEQFIDVLKRQALRYKLTPCIGRTHGVHADITSFGLKFVLWHAEMKRNLERFDRACEDIEVGKMSGAVGNFANIPPFVERYVCKRLGICPVAVSTQVVQRDRHAYYMATLALIASTMEKIAMEIRNLQRTEVHEVEENFGQGQKGSSAMPHKRNPITSENICGCARVMRGYMATFYENNALWHERDISHSSTERIILPDATMLLDYMMVRFGKTLDNLTVFEDVMLENIYKTGKIIFAQRVMNLLISKNWSREKAYDTVQQLAMQAYSSKQDFQVSVSNNEEIQKVLTETEIDSCFTLDYYFKEINYIYKQNNIFLN
ncbi:MAG: adenylosuccinate lyase [Prevotellaceae bacterium]|jgi:adenylosuccinate lyase|nr:adenylosuccinate lyase [Prevotellaceae bacterium]